MGVGSSLLQGAGAAIGQAADLEQALNQIEYASKASREEMEAVRRTARELGADLSLPATSSLDAARAMHELVKGGLSLQQAMDAARGTLALSAAATIEVGDAAKITVGALSAFKLSGSDAGRVADLLAAAANKTQGEITDFAEALRQSGSVAHQVGLTIDETVTALSLMAKAGIQGSDAGTSLKTMLQRLAPESAEAQRAMKELGVSAYDSTKALKPLREIIYQYSEALKRASAEQRSHYLQVIFGQDAMRAATEILLSGRDAYDELQKAVTESGAAMGLAGAKASGLKGALEGLNSTLETFGEKHASRVLGFLTEVVRLASNGITAVDNLAASFGRLSGTKLPGPTGYLRTINEALDAYNQRVANEATPIGKAVQLREDIATLRTAQANNARPAWDLSARWRNNQSRGDIEAAIRRVLGELTPDQESQMVGFPRPGLIASALAKAQQMDAASTSAIIGSAHAGRPFNVQGLPAGWPFNLPGMGGDPRLTTGAQEQAKKDAEKAARAAQAAARKQEAERRRVETEKAEFLRVSAEADRLEADAARRARSAAFTGTLASLRDASDPLTARVLSNVAASHTRF
jgi:TP901 family phage tail tape measure protein